MAEGLLEGLLGEEPEEAEGDAAGAALDPAAAAAAMETAKYDPALSKSAATYFDQQRRLVEIQTEHLHEQRAVQLSHLKLRRFTDRLKAGMQIFFIGVAIVVAASVLVMLYDAFTSRSVVVGAFKAPVALAPRGLTGEVVATQVLDQLQALQDATRAPNKGLKSHGAWASDIKIEVPETGVSLGELDRLLHERLGHDVHIDGDLVQTDSGGLALTVRGDDIAAKTFAGAIGDVDKLATQAAEYIYGQAEPTRYAVYLLDNRRFADAVAFIPHAFIRAPGDERAKLADSWGDAYANLGQDRQASAKFRLAMALAKPRSAIWWEAWNSVLGAGASTEEEVWRRSSRFLAAAAVAPAGERPPLPSLWFNADRVWDYPLELSSDLQNAALNGGSGVSTMEIAGPELAYIYVRMHDFPDADRYLADSDPDDVFTKAVSLYAPGMAALERGDPQGAIPMLEANRAFVLGTMGYSPNGVGSEFMCNLGLAYRLVGRQAEAMQVFDAGHGLSLCAALQGDALARAGDIAGAQHVWTEGIKLAPSMPPIYLHRGQFELDHGAAAAAETDFRLANSKAPHWADPLKAWGDLLARKGDWRGAKRKYAEALRYAPAWADLLKAKATADQHAGWSLW